MSVKWSPSEPSFRAKVPKMELDYHLEENGKQMSRELMIWVKTPDLLFSVFSTRQNNVLTH